MTTTPPVQPSAGQPAPQQQPPANRSRGHYLRLSTPRKLICDLLHFARRVPSLPVQRQFNLRQILEAPRCASRPGWVPVFCRAYGIVAREIPALRRSYLELPTARLYEHPVSVASVAVGRVIEGEEGVLFGHLVSPEDQGVVALDAHVRRYKTAPLDQIHSFREALRYSRWPTPVRRLGWWLALNLSGPARAKRFGTFGVSVYSRLGADSLHPLSPLTTVLNYGPIAPDGTVTVRIVYDHRVLDGETVARALVALERTLEGQVAAEVRELARSGRQAPPQGELHRVA